MDGHIGVEVRNALCGFVELKAPGLGAQTKKLKDRDKRQWDKFSALPNILYTDALEWALYRTGAQTGQDKKPILIRFGISPRNSLTSVATPRRA